MTYDLLHDGTSGAHKRKETARLGITDRAGVLQERAIPAGRASRTREGERGAGEEGKGRKPGDRARRYKARGQNRRENAEDGGESGEGGHGGPEEEGHKGQDQENPRGEHLDTRHKKDVCS
jgi:hypothetical protein